MTNFLEGSSEDIVENYIETLIKGLSSLIQSGISIVKENGVTALASLAEAAKGKYVSYYQDTLNFMSEFLVGYNEPCYKQFKGQVIEAVTIISAAVGMEHFRAHAPKLIEIMIGI